MNKINRQECLNLLSEKFPKYFSYRKLHIAYWGEDDDMFSIMSPLQDYTLDVIKANNTAEIKKIFDFAEFLMLNGDQSVQDGIATQFLENLMNKDLTEFKLIIPYLGKESIEYCRAWDKFTRVRTEGLWDESQ